VRSKRTSVQDEHRALKKPSSGLDSMTSSAFSTYSSCHKRDAEVTCVELLRLMEFATQPYRAAAPQEDAYQKLRIVFSQATLAWWNRFLVGLAQLFSSILHD
jgi:hypothetical protein